MNETYDLLTTITNRIEKEDEEKGFVLIDDYISSQYTKSFNSLPELMTYISNTYILKNIGWVYTDTKDKQTKITGFCINTEEQTKEDEKIIINTETVWLSIFKVITEPIIEDDLKTLLNNQGIIITNE